MNYLNTPWPDGDMPNCSVRCDKCQQLRLRGERLKPNWCRRCKYENYDEYFGEGGVNEQKYGVR